MTALMGAARSPARPAIATVKKIVVFIVVLVHKLYAGLRISDQALDGFLKSATTMETAAAVLYLNRDAIWCLALSPPMKTAKCKILQEER